MSENSITSIALLSDTSLAITNASGKKLALTLDEGLQLAAGIRRFLAPDNRGPIEIERTSSPGRIRISSNFEYLVITSFTDCCFTTERSRAEELAANCGSAATKEAPCGGFYRTRIDPNFARTALVPKFHAFDREFELIYTVVPESKEFPSWDYPEYISELTRAAARGLHLAMDFPLQKLCALAKDRTPSAHDEAALQRPDVANLVFYRAPVAVECTEAALHLAPGSASRVRSDGQRLEIASIFRRRAQLLQNVLGQTQSGLAPLRYWIVSREITIEEPPVEEHPRLRLKPVSWLLASDLASGPEAGAFNETKQQVAVALQRTINPNR